MLADELEPCVAEHGDMAKKKAVEAKTESKQKILLVYKADERTFDEMKEWIDGLAAEIGAPVTVMFDMALKGLAKERKYRPMPKRLAR